MPAGTAEKSDDFTHCRITYFQFNLPSPGRHRTIERKTIILPRTNEERGRMKRGWNRRTEEEDSLALAREGRTGGTSLRMRRREEYERMGDSIVGVARPRNITGYSWPNPTDSGVQPFVDNRAGYVVDLAGNIYELLLFSPLSLFSLSLSLCLFSFIISYCFLFFPSLLPLTLIFL